VAGLCLRSSFLGRAAAIALALAGLWREAAAEPKHAFGPYMSQPVTLFDLGLWRLERDIRAAAPWLADLDGFGVEPVAGVQFDRRNGLVIVFAALYRPVERRNRAECIAAFRRLVDRLLAATPDGADRAGWYLENVFAPPSKEGTAHAADAARLVQHVRLEVVLRGRGDDVRVGETLRVHCIGRLNAGNGEIEQRQAN
jgi:hypothetical protein